MNLLSKIGIAYTLWQLLSNKHVSAQEAYTGDIAEYNYDPVISESGLINFFTDDWVSYPEAIMSNAIWKINDYDMYANTIANAEQYYGIPTDMLGRLLFQESRFRPDIINGTVKSSAGALGIAQFMPMTASEYNINPLDPLAAIDAAGKYLSRLYAMFGNWETALGAYNFGPGNMKKYLAGKVQLPQETQKYMAEIMADVNYA